MLSKWQAQIQWILYAHPHGPQHPIPYAPVTDRRMMVLKELNGLRVLVKLAGAGAVPQTRPASSKMLLKVTPMTCGPVSLL